MIILTIFKESKKKPVAVFTDTGLKVRLCKKGKE